MGPAKRKTRGAKVKNGNGRRKCAVRWCRYKVAKGNYFLCLKHFKHGHTEFPLSIMDFDKEVYVNIDEYEEEEKEEAKNEQEPKPNVVLKVDNVVINLNKKKGGD